MKIKEDKYIFGLVSILGMLAVAGALYYLIRVIFFPGDKQGDTT
jgi:hypothetical protein